MYLQFYRAFLMSTRDPWGLGANAQERLNLIHLEQRSGEPQKDTLLMGCLTVYTYNENLQRRLATY